MIQILKGFALSISMLTIIPFFKVHDFYKGINGYAVMFYPLVGFLLGMILWGTFVLLQNFLPLMHLSILIFSLLILLTGAIHLDGFSDTVDGLYVAKEKALEVMKDPNTGGMGMIFSVVFLILKASSIVSLLVIDATLIYLLPIVLMLSRFNAVIAIYFYPYISKNGMGSLAKEELKLFQVIIAFIYVIALVIIFYKISLLFISLSVFLFLGLFFIKRYSGFTGDIYGFSIEVTELILLNFILITIL
ncbi:MAG: adenosylcobinamide-GDP ribazoletransferase [Campylobacterota bacterium]|nr:adenosylcobinamide-GDP ribazoletransferase [Campylobacterota bacterium]